LSIGDSFIYPGGLRGVAAGSTTSYDVVITIADRSISGPIRMRRPGDQLLTLDGSSSEDVWVEYNLRIVEPGSATVANPAGTPVVLNDFTIALGDIDSENNQDFSELVGYNTVGVSNVEIGSNLELGGFDNGGSTNNPFILYRLRKDRS